MPNSRNVKDKSQVYPLFTENLFLPTPVNPCAVISMPMRRINGGSSKAV